MNLRTNVILEVGVVAILGGQVQLRPWLSQADSGLILVEYQSVWVEVGDVLRFDPVKAGLKLKDGKIMPR